jgi:glycine/D-amino acid oxidase-like deaminating enzyme
MNEAVVIGAGLVGSAIASRLAAADVRVTTIDTGFPGGGTSGASFAWLNSNSKTPRAYHDLNVAGMREHRALAAEFGSAPWLHEGGNLEWSHADDERDREQLRAKVERLRSWGYAVESLSPQQARAELEPDLVFEHARVEEVIFYPEEAWIDPLPLIHALLEDASQRGARLLAGSRVVQVVIEGGRVQGVLTQSGERIAADIVVNCAGRLAGEVAALAGVELPMANTAGLLALTTPAPTCIRRVIHALDLNLRPDGAGRLLLHSEEIDETIDPATIPDAALPGCAELLRRAQRLLPALGGTRVEAARIGVRPIPRDGLSAVGPLPGVEGLYTAVTHSGATLCALLGRLMAQEILERRSAPELASFRPDRFSGREA